MSCEDFVTFGPWAIADTEGQLVTPFVLGNVVKVDDGPSGSFIVKVFKDGKLQGEYSGFQCAGATLNGEAGEPPAPLSMGIEIWNQERRRVRGEWARTAGTWTGNDGGGSMGVAAGEGQERAVRR